MDPRSVIPLDSLNDFFQLLKFTPKDGLKLFATYRDELSKCINSIEDVFYFLDNADRTLKEEISKNSQILKGGFKTPQDLLLFLQRDEDHIFYSLTNDKASLFNQHLIALFSQPTDVMQLVENYREASERLFQDGFPCASELVFSNHFPRLRKLSLIVASMATMTAANALIKQPINSETFIHLSTLYNGLPAKERYSIYISEQVADDVRNFISLQLKKLLNSQEHRVEIDTLAQPANLMRLRAASHPFALELLKVRNIIDIFFGGKLTLEGLISEGNWFVRDELLKRHPAEIAALFKTSAHVRVFCAIKYNGHYLESLPKEHLKSIGALFASSTVMEDWLWLAKGVAAHNGDSPSFGLTTLAAATLKEYPYWEEKEDAEYFKIIQSVFLNAENLTRITEICPGFASKIIETLQKNSKKQKESATNPIELFKDPAVFWKFIQAGGATWLLSSFSQGVCDTYPEHIAYIFQQSEHFAKLDAKFTAKLVAPPGWGHWNRTWKNLIELLETNSNISYVLENFPNVFDEHDLIENPKRLIGFAKTADDLVALVKTNQFAVTKAEDYRSSEFVNKKLLAFIMSPECQIPSLLLSFASPGATLVRLAEVHPLLVNALVEHHPKQMGAVLDLQAFMKLKFYQRFAFAEHAPDAVAAVFVGANINPKDFMVILKDASFDQYWYEWMHAPFCEVFKLRAATFAKIFIYGEPAALIFAMQTYPPFTNILFEYAPYTMAKIYCGPSFVGLVRDFPEQALMLINKLKDNIAALIPTAGDLAAVKKENSMLIKQFAFQWPAEAARQLAAINEATPATMRLSTIAGNRNILLASPRINTEDMDKKISDVDMAESVFGQKRSYSLKK